MAIAIGAQLGTYEVRSLLGKGGMGEVYRALDTRLGREVAIKVLPDAWVSAPDRLARFEREAKVLASLNHPHIAALYGMEDAGAGSAAVRFLVMELVEGETLAERLRPGALTPREALRIATQIAAAIEAAHEKGVVHRDLKPANIKITPDDEVKVLDFGLAKAMDPSPGAGDVTHSPTLSVAATQAGVILGTAGYMSPEQAKGVAVDHRSDIFSFGSVLYEMLTGRPPFRGETAAEVLASVLIRDPDFAALPPNLNPRLVDLLRRCLDKNPKKRWQATGDLHAELEIVAGNVEAIASEASITASAGSTRRVRVAWSVAAVAALAAVALAIPAVTHFREAPPALAPIRTTILAPEGTTLDFTNGVGLPAISPDGRRIVFGARSADGKQLLWVRSLDGLTAQPLGGTEDAAFPFWSPDSRSIAFFAEGKLKRIDAGGGPVLTLADAPNGRGGSWSGDGVIIFAPTNQPGLQRVSSAGGTVTAVPSERGSFPSFLPDGQHFLYQEQSGTGGAAADLPIRVGSLDGAVNKPIGRGSNAMYSQGHLLFLLQGTLMAQRFDLQRLEPTGEATPLVEGVQTVLASGRAGVFSAAEMGMSIYQPGGAEQRRLTWFDRAGNALSSLPPDPDLIGFPELSPDGRRVAIDRNVNGNQDVWLLDLTRGGMTRFTFDALSEIRPAWSVDGSSIVFASQPQTSGAGQLVVKASTGAGAAQMLVDSPNSKVAFNFSPDSRYLLYAETAENLAPDLLALPLQDDRKPIAIGTSQFNESGGQFSPDGRWVAYHSNESGSYEVYVVPFPPGTGKWQVSVDGGSSPRWSRDGRELFYIGPDTQLMAVGVRTSGPSFEAAPPVELFETRIFGSGLNTGIKHQYAVSSDGRFLVTVSSDTGQSVSLTLLQNWAPQP